MPDWVEKSTTTSSANGGQDGEVNTLDVWGAGASLLIPGETLLGASATGWIGLRFRLYDFDTDSDGNYLNQPLIRMISTGLTLNRPASDGADVGIRGFLWVFGVPEVAPSAYSQTRKPGTLNEHASTYASGFFTLPTEEHAFAVGVYNFETSTTLTLDMTHQQGHTYGSNNTTHPLVNGNPAGQGFANNDINVYQRNAGWNGYINFSIYWLQITGGSNFRIVSSEDSDTSLHPTLTWEEYPAHSGFQGKPLERRARGTFCERIGLPMLSDEMMWDGYVPGLKVSARGYDPADPRDLGDTYVAPPNEGVLDNELEEAGGPRRRG